MFFVGGLPALLTLFIRARSEGKPASVARLRRATDWSSLPRGRYFQPLEAVPLSGAADGHDEFMSHGTQDMYPTFLQQQRTLPAQHGA